jgi:hypothetical protein
MKTKNCQVYRCSRVALCATKRWIGGPTYSGSLFYKSTKYQLGLSHRQQ